MKKKLKYIMKSRFCGIILCLLGVLLTGCGKENEEDSREGKAEYKDIMVEREEFPDFKENFFRDGKKHTLYYMNIQFLGEEPVQLWAEQYMGNKENIEETGDYKNIIFLADIYLWRMNGERELLVKGIDMEYVYQYVWYRDQDGCFYLISNIDPLNLVIKLDSQGKEIFRVEKTESVLWEPFALCQSPDNKVYLMIMERNKGYQLAQLDSDAGTVTVLEEIELDPAAAFSGNFFLGTGINGPAVCSPLDIREINTETGEMADIMLFNGTSYSVRGNGSGEYSEYIKTFRVKEENNIEIIRTNSDGSTAYVESLHLETVQKTPVVLGAPMVDDWIKRQINRFNQENDTYYIVIEEIGESDGTREEEYANALEDYSRRVGVQVAAGKGPDILVGNEIFNGNVLDMMEKGILEDLRPFMEKSGIREEDYFPLVFNAWTRGEEIYGICPEAILEVQEGNKDIIGENIRDTVENLLKLQEKAAYRKKADCREMLRMFLEGSETIWGMVDWEAGTCDFEEEFFKDILEVCQKYGYISENQVPYITDDVPLFDFYWTASSSELEERGRTLAGGVFDDGYHAKVVYAEPIAINSGSAQKEGAWEFLCFLLGDEAQESVIYFPLKRDTFKKWENKQLKRVSDVRNLSVYRTNLLTGENEDVRKYTEKDRELIETEKLSYFEKMVEEARHLPIRSVPVVNIICQEAEDYFNGNKSAEEVIKVIENRVSLYLNEKKQER